MPRFYVENFGCRAARADGEAVSARLRAEGLDEGGLSAADVVVINTCSVTAEADRDARAFVRKTQRTNPAAKIIVTGCYAQRAPEEIAGLAAAGLAGLEVWHPDHTEKERRWLLAAATELDLIPTGGSDDHGQLTGYSIARETAAPDTVDRLLARAGGR